MPSFVYMARDRSGTVQSGHLDAVGEDEVVSILQGRGLIVTSLSEREMAQAAFRQKVQASRRLHGRITLDDLVLFCQQLATLVEAGVPLLRSLEVVSMQAESRELLYAIEQMRRDIEGGSKFGNAMARHPHIFSKLWVSLVETGEASGNLAQSLHQIARYLESLRNLQSKAATAMTYPLVLIIVAVFVLAFFILKIIPIFKQVFDSMNVPLPALTRATLFISDVCRQYVFFIVAGVAAAIYFGRQFVRTEQGRWLVDRAALKLPIFNRLFIQLQLAYFAKGLSTLLASGVPILTSLEIMENSASNMVYAKAIRDIRELVREGKPMAEPMGSSGLFPPMMVQMVQVGEEIGELGKMLNRVAAYYEQRVDTFIERMSVLFEPIAIVVMAVIIGTLVISIFLPIFSLAGGLQAGSGP